MKFIPVIALVNSRLEADIAIIKLRRAGIDRAKISAIFPLRYVPNAVACWLLVRRCLTLDFGCETVLSAGPLNFESGKPGSEVSVVESIEKIGFDHETAAAFVGRLKMGETLICVHAANEREASVAWRVFRSSMADATAVGWGRAASIFTPRERLHVPSWKPAAA
jgi:hypothetical protein